MITSLYTGILALALAGLFLYVVKNRMKHRVSLGDGDVEALKIARSVHGNFVETVPFILLIMFLLEGDGVSPTLIHVFGILLILSRILHFIGIHGKYSNARPRLFAGITTVSLFIVGGLLLIINFIA